MKGMPLYTALPTLAEYAVEQGWTQCYSKIDEVGWASWMMSNIAYLMFCEFWIYWMHRGLHEIKPLYRLLHATHHIYNKENTLSPFAGSSSSSVRYSLPAAPFPSGLLFNLRAPFSMKLSHFEPSKYRNSVERISAAQFFQCPRKEGFHYVYRATRRTQQKAFPQLSCLPVTSAM